MKKTLFFLFVFAVLSPVLLQAKDSELYSIETLYRKPVANNTEVFKNFLYQSDGSSTNYKILGLSEQEMSDGSWLNNKTIEKILKFNAKYEIIEVRLINYKLIGDLDMSSFTALKELEIKGTALTSLDFSNASALSNPIIAANANLKTLKATNMSLGKFVLNDSEKLEYIDFSDSRNLALDYDDSYPVSYIKIENLPQLKEVNLSGFYNLKDMELLNLKNLTHVDLSKTNRYTTLQKTPGSDYFIKNTNLEYLDITGSIGIWGLIIVNAGNLKTIGNDTSPYTFDIMHGYLSIDGIKSDTFKLENIYIYSGNIFFTNNHNVKSLDITTSFAQSMTIEDNNQLEELKSGRVKSISIKNNKLTFRDIHVRSSSSDYIYEYAPQQKIIGENISVGKELDLSIDYQTIKENIPPGYDNMPPEFSIYTKFNWYDGEEKAAVNELKSEGVFSFDEKFVGKTLLCKMTNDLYPSLILEYEVKVVGSLSNNTEIFKSFLYQSDGSSTNYKILGLSEQEMSGDSWLNNKTIKKILKFNTKDEIIEVRLINYKLIGDLDMSSFTALKKMEIRGTALTSLNFSNASALSNPIIAANANLKTLKATNTGLRDIVLNDSEKLESIDLSDSRNLELGEDESYWSRIKIENLPQLREVNLSGFYNVCLVELLNLKNLVRVDLSNIDNTKNIWNQARPSFIIKNTNLEYLDITGCKDIISLEIVNAGNLKKIGRFLDKYTFNLTNGSLLIDGIKSDTFELENIDIYGGSITFTNNHNIKSLDLTTCFAGQFYIEDNNQLETLKLGGFKALFIKNNKLTFSGMFSHYPYTYSYPYEYAPQQKVIGEDIMVGKELDFSIKYQKEEQNFPPEHKVYTEFNWYDGAEKVAVNELRQGVFSFDEKFVGKTLLCKMTNELFSSLVLEYEVKVVGALSVIDEEENRKNISVYPNPTSDIINIRSKDIIHSLEVYSITGALIKKYTELNTLEQELPVQGWTAGIYIIKVKTKEGTKSIRFYKK